MENSFDLIIIGAGPGGYVAAIRAAQLGLKVACVDKNPEFGGTCLRVGCIPSKALLESSERFHAIRHSSVEHGIEVGGVRLNLKKMMQRKDEVVASLTQGVAYLFKKNGISGFHGLGYITSANEVMVMNDDGETRLEAKKILIASGSKAAMLPGVKADGRIVGTSTEAIAFDSVPEHLVVIGAGVIGLELGSVWKRLGAKVTVLEYLDHILPGLDSDLSKSALKAFKKQGLEFKLSSKVSEVRIENETATVMIEGAEAVQGNRVLVAVGRKPNTDGLGLENVRINLDAKGFIPVNDHYETSTEGIYAIGDVIGGAMLAHKAEEEGIACVEQMVSGYGHVNYDAIPTVVYTEPEIASVGPSEEALKEAGIAYNKGSFPYLANGRAKALGHPEGKVKVLAHAETDRVLAVHIIGKSAGDLIAEAVAAIEFGASAEDIARISHAHPTLSETVKEAALAVEGRALHI